MRAYLAISQKDLAAFIDSKSIEVDELFAPTPPPAGFLRSRTPSSLPGAARALFVHHLAQNGAVPAHHIIAALSVGRSDAVLDDFDEVFDYYFNKLTQARLLATPLGRRN